MSRAEVKLWAHMVDNPPTVMSKSDIDLEVERVLGSFSLQKEGFDFQTEYTLNIPETEAFDAENQAEFEEILPNLITSLNLQLNRVCLTGREVRQENFDFEHERETGKAEVVEEENGNVTVRIQETAHLSASIKITMRTEEHLDEEKVLDTLDRINEVREGDELRETNLAKALDSFDEAVQAMGRVPAFKSLFVALEQATNFDGQNREGSTLDSEVSSITGVSSFDVEDLRLKYNRLKHADRDQSDMEQTERIQRDLPSNLRQLREIANRAILTRIETI